MIQRIIVVAFIFIPFLGCGKQQEHGFSNQMIHIPAGEFRMGTNSGDYNQVPAHTVYLDTYYIDKYEVTNRQYEEFILAGGYQKKEYWTKEGWDFIRKNKIYKPAGLTRNLFNDLDQPVVGVTWYEADAYCRWANKRLPTEAEWEKAARGLNEYKYPWGNDMSFANISYLVGGGHRTVQRGSYEGNRSPYGVFDMAGNAAEWCADWYSDAYYRESPGKNPQGPSQEDYKVVRGGSWGSNRLQLQTTYRSKEPPDRPNFFIGFRCVKNTGK